MLDDIHLILDEAADALATQAERLRMAREALNDTVGMFGFMKSAILSGDDWTDRLGKEYAAARAKIDAALATIERALK